MMHIQQTNFIARHFIGFDPFNHFWIDTVAGIPHSNTNPIAALCNADGNHAFPFAGLNPMDDSVFYQRLNQQAGNITAYLFIDIINNREFVAKTCLFDGDVIFDLIQLFFDVDLLIVFLIRYCSEDNATN